MRSFPDIYAAEPIPASAKKEIEALLESGDLFRYTSNSISCVSKLEQEFAEYLDVPYALALNSCSSALFLSLKALGLEKGSRVLIPAFTFAAVPSSVIHADCVPILVNILDNYRIDLGDFESKLEGNISAVIISHMRGHTSDMDEILRLCDLKSIPVIEDAAHSLGTTWLGKKIGSLGKIGCFSFQSYKMINAGEGGMLVTNDIDIITKAIIMSGAYEHNWTKHPFVTDRFEHWQNKLPLYNLRISNLSAVVARSQIPELPNRVQKGLENHDYVADCLNASPWLDVPSSLKHETRAPDSIQFNLVNVHSDEQAKDFENIAIKKGVNVQIFGLSKNNARAFWNWEFIGPQGDLSSTRKILERACDVRLPINLSKSDLKMVAIALIEAAEEAAQRAQ